MDAAQATALGRSLGIPPLAARVLWARGYRTAEAARKFLSPALADLHAPVLLRDMDAAVARLHRDIADWLQSLPPVARGKLAARFGSHFGPVILSRLGAADHQHIAATGDTVNVASRLMEAAKQRGAPIAVSEDLCRAAGTPGDGAALELSEPVAIDIRGRAEPLSVRFAGLGAVHA